MFSEDKIPVNLWLSKCAPALPMGKALEYDRCVANICIFAWCQHAETCSEGLNIGPWPTLEGCRGIWGAQACSMGSRWAGLKTTEGSAVVGCQVFLFGLPAIHMLTGRFTPLHMSSYPLYFPWCTLFLVVQSWSLICLSQATVPLLFWAGTFSNLAQGNGLTFLLNVGKPKMDH